MIRLARTHARSEQLEERVHFDTGNVANLPYPDQSFDVVVSTISMHHCFSALKRGRKPRDQPPLLLSTRIHLKSEQVKWVCIRARKWGTAGRPGGSSTWLYRKA